MRKRGGCVSACPAGTLGNCSAWESRPHSSPWATLGLFFRSVPIPRFPFAFTVTPPNPLVQHPVSHRLPVASAVALPLTMPPTHSDTQPSLDPWHLIPAPPLWLVCPPTSGKHLEEWLAVFFRAKPMHGTWAFLQVQSLDAE